MDKPEIVEGAVVETVEVDRKKLVKQIAIIAGTTIALHVVATVISKKINSKPELPTV